MIKIVLNNESDIPSLYYTAIKASILSRLDNSKILLGILTGENFGEKITRYNYSSLGAIGRNLLQIAGFSDDETAQYQLNSVQNIKNSLLKLYYDEKLPYTTLRGLFDLCTFLRVEENLEYIIKCNAEELRSCNLELQKYFLNEVYNSNQFCRLLMDYESFTEISSIIKKFAINLQLNTCPYCNIGDIEFRIRQSDGKVMNGPEMDHFFDKATYPLLSFSFFNIIPSCETCNGTRNKGSIPFTEEFHLNPFFESFKKDAVFEPIPHENGVVGQFQVVLKVKVAAGSCQYKKLIGRGDEAGADLKKGNINVFGLKEKYKNKTDKLTQVASKFDKNSSTYIRSMSSFLKQIESGNNQLFIEHFGCHYDSLKFGQNAYSKLTRDLFDNYVQSLNDRNKRFFGNWWKSWLK